MLCPPRVARLAAAKVPLLQDQLLSRLQLHQHQSPRIPPPAQAPVLALALARAPNCPNSLVAALSLTKSTRSTLPTQQHLSPALLASPLSLVPLLMQPRNRFLQEASHLSILRTRIPRKTRRRKKVPAMELLPPIHPTSHLKKSRLWSCCLRLSQRDRERVRVPVPARPWATRKQVPLNWCPDNGAPFLHLLLLIFFILLWDCLLFCYYYFASLILMTV